MYNPRPGTPEWDEWNKQNVENAIGGRKLDIYLKGVFHTGLVLVALLLFLIAIAPCQARVRLGIPRSGCPQSETLYAKDSIPDGCVDLIGK